MLGAGTVINPIIKIVTTVAILAAVGIFIVRPILDTTDKAINSVNDSVHNAQAQAHAAASASSSATSDFDFTFARSQANGYVSSLQASWPSAARVLRDCIHKADTSHAMQHCADLGERVVTTELGNHNSAMAYAGSLEAQGEGAAADRIRQCVKSAGVKTAAMKRCRDLASRLLFG